MKTKLFKRIGALVLACMMCFALCSTAFAATSRNENIAAGQMMSYVVNPGTNGDAKFWIVTNATTNTGRLVLKVECKGITYINQTIGTQDELDRVFSGVSSNDVFIVTITNNTSTNVPLYFGFSKA